MLLYLLYFKFLMKQLFKTVLLQNLFHRSLFFSCLVSDLLYGIFLQKENLNFECYFDGCFDFFLS